MSPERHCEIVIIGAGFAGIALAVKLREAGIDNFTILERAADLGGVWRDNTYPGCACDVPSHLYSYLFCAEPELVSHLRSAVRNPGLPQERGQRPRCAVACSV